MVWASSGKGGAMDGGKGGKGGGVTRGKVKDPSKAVWVGGVPAGVTFKELLELAREVGDAKWAEVFRGGSAAVGFGSAEEAAGAAVALNGAALGGAALVADTWEKKTPSAPAAPAKGGWGKGSQGGGGGWTPSRPQPWAGAQQAVEVWLPQFQKKGNAKGGGKGGGGRQRVKDPSKAVWIGNIPEGTTYTELLELAQQVGDAKWAEVFPKGSGAVGFGTAEDAAGAAAALNGAVLGSAAILADTWEKKQK